MALTTQEAFELTQELERLIRKIRRAAKKGKKLRPRRVFLLVAGAARLAAHVARDVAD